MRCNLHIVKVYLLQYNNSLVMRSKFVVMIIKHYQIGYGRRTEDIIRNAFTYKFVQATICFLHESRTSIPVDQHAN